MKRMWSKNELKNIADTRVQALIEGGTIENAKPIYYHPIFIRDYAHNIRLTLAILNNNDALFTFDTLKEYIKDLLDNGATIQANGFLTSSSKAYDIFIILKDSGEYRVYGNDYEGNQQYTQLDDITASTFADGVNKIN